MEGRLIDVKAIFEDLDNRMPALINFSGRSELRVELKELQGMSGRGMKRLGRLRACLKCVDVEE
eukprot:8806695-Alexandrium_andersonii.AAC.1